jgi:hypothetical protein
MSAGAMWFLAAAAPAVQYFYFLSLPWKRTLTEWEKEDVKCIGAKKWLQKLQAENRFDEFLIFSLKIADLLLEQEIIYPLNLRLGILKPIQIVSEVCIFLNSHHSFYDIFKQCMYMIDTLQKLVVDVHGHNMEVRLLIF